MQSEYVDYDEWSDEELADELVQYEKDLDILQAKLVSTRKSINKFTEHRDKLLDVISQRANIKGWKKK